MTQEDSSEKSKPKKSEPNSGPKSGDDDLEHLFESPMEAGGADSASPGGVEFLSESAAQEPSQIDDFESLEDFAKNDFAQNESVTNDFAQSEPVNPDFAQSDSAKNDIAQSDSAGDEFAPNESLSGGEAGNSESVNHDIAAGSFVAEDFPQQNFDNAPAFSEHPVDAAGSEIPGAPNPDFSAPSTSDVTAPTSDASFGTSESPLQEPTNKTPTLDSIKEYSESVNTAPPNVAASFPFTLRIDGRLTPQEAEKLIDVMNRENMGFREVDLEPQLAEGKILIPRISEYAGIVLIQALRGIQAKISFGASELFEGDTEESLETRPTSVFTKTEEFSSSNVGHLGHAGYSGHPGSSTSKFPVESPDALPVTQGEELPQLGVYQVSETLIVSGMLSTRSLESANSPEYTSLLEALMRELKFKAFRRKARGITLLKIQVTPLTLPTDHRITVSGTLVI
jgi:hypothetical protein